jgi:hypothetical protein
MLGSFLKEISRYVTRVGVGPVQVDLRTVVNAPIEINTDHADMPGLADKLGALSAATSISKLITSLSELRAKGGAPCAVIDLQAGNKWRLPNLYYLSIIVGVDAAARVFFYTEMRISGDGYFVRSCPPSEFCWLVEEAIPAYSRARSSPT